MRQNKEEIATRHNLKRYAKVTVGGEPGIVLKTGIIFCTIGFSHGAYSYSYSELNDDSEFTFEKL